MRTVETDETGGVSNTTSLEVVHDPKANGTSKDYQFGWFGKLNLDKLEEDKSKLIDSNVSICENRKKRKITPPYSAGMRVCGQASTHGHPCDTGGICVQSGRFCTGRTFYSYYTASLTVYSEVRP